MTNLSDEEKNRIELLLEENKTYKDKLSYLEKRMSSVILELEDSLEKMSWKVEELDRMTWGYHLRRLPRRIARSSRVMTLYGKLKRNKYLFKVLDPFAKLIKKYR